MPNKVIGHSQTSHYYISKLNFVVPTNPKPYTPIAKYTHSISLEVIQILICIFVIIVFFSQCSSVFLKDYIFGSNRKNVVYNFTVSIFGSQIEYGPRKNFARYIMVMWILLFFFVKCFYQAFLYNFYRIDEKGKLPDTIEDILGEYRVIMTQDTYELIDCLPDIQSVANVISKSNIEALDDMLDIPNATALLLPLEYFGYYNYLHRTNDISDNFLVIEEVVLTQPYSIYLKHDSYVKWMFDYYIFTFLSFGLMTKWERTFFDFDDIYGYHAFPKKVTPLTLEDVYGIFIIYGACKVICIIELILELIWFKYKLKTNNKL